MKLDRVDINILAELQKDGRLTNIELAERVHLSASPCLARTKKLQSAGYITGFSAQLDLTSLADVVTVFTEITLAWHRPEDFARFVAVLEKIDQVVECHLISSGYDYLVKFNTCGIAQYQDIMERLLDMNLGIKKYFSYVVFKTPIAARQVPVAAVLRDAAQAPTPPTRPSSASPHGGQSGC
jgi:DNA-binding Lrp family transcriptional regulator